MFADFLDWIRQMIYLLVFLTLLLQILPNGNYKKYVRFFAGMIFVVTLVSPVISMLSDDDFETAFERTLESEMQNAGGGLDEKELQNMEETRESMLQDYADEYIEEK